MIIETTYKLANEVVGWWLRLRLRHLPRSYLVHLKVVSWTRNSSNTFFLFTCCSKSEQLSIIQTNKFSNLAYREEENFHKRWLDFFHQRNIRSDLLIERITRDDAIFGKGKNQTNHDSFKLVKEWRGKWSHV